MSRSLIHLDADAFFVSVEQACDSRLRGKPVAVGGEKRGIVASASYEARRMGVYTPMPTVRARQLCPKLIVLPGDYDRYELFSRWMFAYAFDFTPQVEVTGIDEGYFDLSGTRQRPGQIADIIQKAIGQRLKISVSEGIGTSKLISQIASKCRKPAAFVEVPPGKELDFLHPLPNKWLPGVGPKTALRLDAAGLRTIQQVAYTSPTMLELLLGSQAHSVRDFANGIDERPLIITREAPKSFGEQETFSTDLTDEDYLEAVLRRMADRLMAKVRSEGKCIRTVTVKVRYNDMSEDQRSESLLEPTDLETDLYHRLRPLLKQAWKRRVSLRLVSLKLSNLYSGYRQTELFLDDRPDLNPARRNLARTVDALRREHGEGVVLRAHDLRLREGPREAAVEVRARPAPVVKVQSYIKSTPLAQAVPLNVRSWYSFLDSTLSPEAIVALAQKQGMGTIALTDIGNLHAAPLFARLAKDANIKPVFGAEIRIGNSGLLCYVENPTGYRNLCHLLSRHQAPGTSASEDAEGDSVAALQRLPLTKEQLEGRTEGLLAVSDDVSLAALFPGSFYAAVSSARAAENVPSGLRAVLAPRIHYGTPADRMAWNVMQSIRTRTLLQQPHPGKRLTGAYHFRTLAELNRLAGSSPALLAHTVELADRCTFEFPFALPQFPLWNPSNPGASKILLRELVMDGLQRRYGDRAEQFKPQVLEELGIIAEVGYEDYFLMVWDLLQDCRKAGIEWITRGSAADSMVCYCLEISGVCPARFGLYFKRFLNKDRMAVQKLPDIDIDFPHDRKDDVVDLLFRKHGPRHCAAVGGFSTYQARGAVGDVAKVLGVSEYQIRRLTERFPGSFGRGGWTNNDKPAAKGEELLAKLKNRPESVDLPMMEEPYRTAVLMAGFLDGCPRYPKMHPCGIVLSRDPMPDLTPTFLSRKHYPTSQYDMDAVEPMGLIKMDILAQGGLAAMRDTRITLAERGITVDDEILNRWDDPAVWRMIASGGARAVHHIESPAMTSLCSMVNVREIDGLIAIVSVIRPGAANENKKLNFTRRYQGFAPAEYPHPCLKPCLASTYGLVVYEEHILQICDVFAGMAPGRADMLRRALIKENGEVIELMGKEFLQCARAHQNGYDEATIQNVWDLLSSFQGYAFNKAHSTAYGVEAYQAAWLKHYHPADFMAAVLTNGKGFYSPLVYILECHRLGLRLLPPCLNDPGPGFMVRDGAIRVPVSAIKGMSQRTLDAMISGRQKHGPFSSLSAFHEIVRPSPEELELLIRAGACDGLDPSRTHLFWEAQVCRRRHQEVSGKDGWLLAPPSLDFTPTVPPAEPTRRERLQAETELLGYTVSGHPLELHDGIAWDTYCPVDRLVDFMGETVVLCGLTVVSRVHSQSTGELMKFLTLADRTGMVEAELFGSIYKKFGLATVRFPVVEVTATVEPFENGNGYTLRVHHAGKPRSGGREFKELGSPGVQNVSPPTAISEEV